MTSSNDSTTLVCLFHHDDQARAALEDLYAAGIPKSLISVVGSGSTQGSGSASSPAGLETMGIPERDLKHLRDGIEDGGTIVAVSATSQYVDTVEEIFGKHQATKIDEAATRDDATRDGVTGAAPLAAAAAPIAASAARGGVPNKTEGIAGQTAIPVVEEQLQVGKRTVDQGGVRVYRRIVEMPVEESINLREERVVVERNAVNRAATQAELEAQGNRSIELTETAEEAVISKNARVVEEVVVGKESGEHTQHIQETVRRTEVEVEELPAADRRTGPKGSY